jgi:hypothetical protein
MPLTLSNRRFVREHHALHEWLTAHPEAAEALRADPPRYQTLVPPRFILRHHKQPPQLSTLLTSFSVTGS